MHVQPIEKRRAPARRPAPRDRSIGCGRRTNAVVAGLPKSWHTAPSITASLLRPRQVVDARARLIDHLQRVHPDVAFGMPLRLLRAAGERLQLGKQLRRRRRDPSRARSRSTAAARTAAFRFRPRRARPADRRAESRGTARASRLVERELEPRRELHRAQHAQAVVAERRRIDDAQQAPREIARGRRTDRDTRR